MVNITCQCCLAAYHIRILIIDWDVHHGNGIQYMFYDDPRYVTYTISHDLA